MNKWNLTKQEIEFKYSELKSIRAVAEYFRIPVASMRLIFKENDIGYVSYPNVARKKTIKLNENDLRLAFFELKNIDLVAARFGVSRSTIKKNFREYEINYANCIKNKFDEGIFGREDPCAFYLAGFIAADGNVKGNNITIGLSIKDKQHLVNIKTLLKLEYDLYIYDSCKYSAGEIDGRKIIGGKISRLYCNSNQAVFDLKRFNIVPNKSKIYDFPEWLMGHKLVNHFMRGYFDGDGHIGIHKVKGKTKTSQKLRFSLVGNVWFLEKYQSILESNCDISHNNIYMRTDTFGQLEYSGNIVVPKICEFLYNNSAFHLDRKYQVYKKFLSSSIS